MAEINAFALAALPIITYPPYRTPENSGFITDRSNTNDTTTALNNFFTLLSTSGDPGMLPAGQYKTSAEVLFPTSSVRGLNLVCAHGRRTQIMPTGNTYNGFRAQGNGFTTTGYGINITGLSVVGPNTSPPKNGFAAIVLDKAPQAILRDCFGSSFDIALDFINNCFNSSVYGFRTSRGAATVNCAVNIRDGNNSGSDLNFYDLQAIGINTALCIQGGGGGYRIYGGSLASWGTVNTDDKYGAITLGWSYVSDTASGAPDGVFISGIHMEGVTNRYHLRTYGPCAFEMANTAFYPSASAVGSQSKGLWKASDAQNISGTWTNNQLGQNSIFASAELVNIAGQNNDFQVFESGWVAPAATIGGTSKGRGWLKTIGEFSNLTGTSQRGIYNGIDGPTGYSFIGMGSARLRYQPFRTHLELSLDNGANWQRADAPELVTSALTAFTPAVVNTNTHFTMTAGTAVTWNLPTKATLALRTRSRFRIYQDGAGTVTVTPAAGVTLRNPYSTATTLGQYCWIEIEETGTTDVWRVVSRSSPT